MPVSAGVGLLVLVSFAAWTDVRSRRIPNALCAAGILLGFALHTQLRGVDGLTHSAMGLGVAFACYFALYVLRAIGAGDVKLMAAVGSLTGPGELLALLLFVFPVGALMGLVVVALKRRWKATAWNTAMAVADLMRLRAPASARPQLDVGSGQGLSLPHALAVAAGSYLFLWIRLAH